MAKPELTYANVMSTIGVFIALGGTSYAVARNSVGERQLKADAVTSPKIRDGSVSAGDLAPDVIFSGPRGPRGAVGPQGPNGERGSHGERGPAGPSATYVDRNTGPFDLPVLDGSLIVGELRLPAGSYALDFNAHAYLSSGSTWVDCVLRIGAANQALASVHIGAEASATIEAVTSISDAAEIADSVPVRVICYERSATDAKVADMRLRAVRVESVIDQ